MVPAAPASLPKSFCAKVPVHGPAANTMSVADIDTSEPSPFFATSAMGCFESGENSMSAAVAIWILTPRDCAISTSASERKKGWTCPVVASLPSLLGCKTRIQFECGKKTERDGSTDLKALTAPTHPASGTTLVLLSSSISIWSVLTRR